LNVALVLTVDAPGPESIVVFGARVSVTAKRITSSGRLSPFSRLWKTCSGPL
jgi:hypothetical protein